MTATEPTATEPTALEHLDATRTDLLEDKYVLRMTETEAEEHSGLTEDQHMIMNLGPQHPSTHGVLRVVLELEGELIRRSRPVIGYLHTGMEKTGEQLTYLQGPTNVTRMDYASPLFNETVFSLATEELLGIEVPERATWIRTLLCEVNRISSHMLFLHLVSLSESSDSEVRCAVGRALLHAAHHLYLPSHLLTAVLQVALSRLLDCERNVVKVYEELLFRVGDFYETFGEDAVTSPRQIRRKVPSTMAAASPRFRWRSSRSTSGVRSSCRSSEMKMMNASCGKNQNVDSRTVNVTPKRMDVR